MYEQWLAYVLTWVGRRSVHLICNLIFFQKYYIIYKKEIVMKNKFRKYCAIILLGIFWLFFIQFMLVAPNMDWSWHFVRTIEYPIPYLGMLVCVITIGGIVVWDSVSKK
jgi:hypothetical protein